MLWFKVFFSLKVFKPDQFLFSFALDFGNESEAKGNKNYTGLKIFKPKKNLNHNVYMYICTLYFIEN